jgi:hypothetical protein
MEASLLLPLWRSGDAESLPHALAVWNSPGAPRGGHSRRPRCRAPYLPRIRGKAASPARCACPEQSGTGPCSPPAGVQDACTPDAGTLARLLPGDCASELTRPPSRRRPCSALGHAYAPRGGPVDCVALGNRSRVHRPGVRPRRECRPRRLSSHLETAGDETAADRPTGASALARIQLTAGAPSSQTRTER